MRNSISATEESVDSPACEEEAEYVRECPSLNSGCSEEEELEFEKIALLLLLLPLSRLRRFVPRGDSPNVYAIVIISIVVLYSCIV